MFMLFLLCYVALLPGIGWASSASPKVLTEIHQYRAIHTHGYQYISPWPEAEYLPKQSWILVRFAIISPYDLTNLNTFITATGSKSGSHIGSVAIASDSATIIFKPSDHFSANETVTIALSPEVSQGSITPVTWTCYISNSKTGLAKRTVGKSTENVHVLQKMAADESPNVIRSVQSDPVIMGNGVSVPGDFPYITITTNNNPAPGYLFIDYTKSPRYSIIFDPNGNPVWYKRGLRGRDFKMHKNGTISLYPGGGRFNVYDQNFNLIANPGTVNGYETDDHELEILEDGGYLIIGRNTESVDLSQYVAGGHSNASVRETVLQEFTAQGELIFQWRAWDNFDIMQMEDWCDDDRPSEKASIRFPHINAIDIDDDGHILLSSKRIGELTKIHRKTGEILWRLGGDSTQFEILNDPLDGFNLQHDINRTGSNRYMIFDNHFLNNETNSRAVEYQLDTTAMTATMVWQYQENPPYRSYHMGNAQRLPSGNTLINWVVGRFPKATEVTSDGTKVYEMNWTRENSKSYRVFKFPWNGMVEKPDLLIEAQPDNITLLMNKFGDPDVAWYEIYGGTSVYPTTLLDTSRSTLKKLTDLENNKRYYFRVKAVAADGSKSDYSNMENIRVQITQPEENLIANGDFSEEKTHWLWQTTAPASATWDIENEMSVIRISDGGTDKSHVQLTQNNIQLIQGQTYQFDFDALASASRPVEIKIAQGSSPWTNYSQIGYTYISTQKTTYTYSFTMNQPTTQHARVEINLGNGVHNIYLDNLKLKTTSAATHPDNPTAPEAFRLLGNYPNPFNPKTVISYSVPDRTRIGQLSVVSPVHIRIYNARGELVETLVNQTPSPGITKVEFDASELSSGLYFYNVRVNRISKTGKMMLLK